MAEITDSAVTEFLSALSSRGLFIGPGNKPLADVRTGVRGAIEAALPHLGDVDAYDRGWRAARRQAEAAPDDARWKEGFEAGQREWQTSEEVAKARERIRDEAFARGVLIGKDEASSETEVFALLAAGIPIPESASTERERNAERRHREEIARALARPTLVADVEFETSGPTDYEVWRDALTMAAAQRDRRTDLDKPRIVAEAEAFWELLREVPMQHDPDDDPPPGPIPAAGLCLCGKPFHGYLDI